MRGFGLTIDPSLRGRWLLALSQWAALLLGILCVGVSIWAAFQGGTAFSAAHYSPVIEDALTALKWFLVLVVTLSGIKLLRFAFFKPDEMGANHRRS